MEELIVNKLNILLLSFLLTACGNSTTEPKEQQEFKSLISSLSNEYKTAKNSDIVLINGDLLTTLMIEFGLGVQVERSFHIYKIDQDRFDEENF